MTPEQVQLTSKDQLTYTEKGGFIMNKIKKMIKNERGMTLIELLAVIVIIAIIALIAIPAIGNIINNSHDKAILADASSIISGAKIAIADGECPEDTCSAKALENFVTKPGVTLEGVSVEFKENEYTLTYSELGNMKGKLKGKVKSPITSNDLAKLMKNNNVKDEGE